MYAKWIWLVLKNYVTTSEFIYRTKKRSKCIESNKQELNSLDLRHFGWNIGTRLGYKGDSKAYFIKNVFQEELKHLSLSTLQQTLRQDGKCSIKINIPKADSFQFKED